MTSENYLKNLADMQTQIKELVPNSLKENGEIRMIPEKEREALMRLTMCARRHCAICKYKGKYTYEDCMEEITYDMHILMDALEKTMDLLEKIEKSNEEIDKLMADSPLNGW